jgi:membrane associated rhomboid family serine protease
VVFIPVTDTNRRTWIQYHYVTVALICACIAVFILQIGGGQQGFLWMVYAFGAIPAVLFGSAALPDDVALIPSWFTLVTSMFLHGGVAHLAGNMLFLWVFGDNVEDAMGHRRFILFYLLCGAIAALAHAAVVPESVAPMIGASGAISGVLGAYFILHPRVQVWIIVFAFIPLRLPTYLVLGTWAAMQVILSFAADEATNQVAWWAHIAGFAAGAGLIRFFRYPHVVLWDTSATGSIDIHGVRLRSRLWEKWNGGDR